MLVLKVFNWGLIAPGRQLSLVGKHLLILKNSTMPKHPDSVYSLNITPLLILLMLKVEGSLFRGNINHSHVVLQQRQFCGIAHHHQKFQKNPCVRGREPSREISLYPREIQICILALLRWNGPYIRLYAPQFGVFLGFCCIVRNYMQLEKFEKSLRVIWLIKLIFSEHLLCAWTQDGLFHLSDLIQGLQ